MIPKHLKLLFAQEVRDHKDVLFKALGGPITKKLKDSIWEEIRQKLISSGAVIKDVPTLRDVEWYNLKKSSQTKYRNSLKSGEAGSKLTDLDECVMDVLGRQSANVIGLNLPDMDLSFATSTVSNNNINNSTFHFPGDFDSTMDQFLVPAPVQTGHTFGK
jgi:hypothetical protein